uniref:Uncharacterized protein n=1 Tax=Opuntia streptacantha TaxID=393608 RepID=A0A7C8YR75_OPUST
MASLSISSSLNPKLHHFKPKNPSNYLKIQAAHVAKDQQFHKLYKSDFTNASSLSKNGQIQEALNLPSHMDNNGVQVVHEFYVELLQECVKERALFLGQQIHALIIKRGDVYAGNEYIETKLVIFYAKCDALESANLLFSRLSEKNVFSWAAVIGMNSRLGLDELGLVGYCEMLEYGSSPDNFVIPNALKACGAIQSVGFGRGIHGYVFKMGFGSCVYVASSLVDMYSKCGVLDDAKRVFDKMTDRNNVVWNSMIVGYVQNGMSEEAIQMSHDMRVEGIEPTRVTLSSLLSASANLGAVTEGRQGHALAVLYGLELDSILGSSLINFYSKIGWIDDVELAFTRMIEKDVVTWNLLLSCYAQHGLVGDAVNTCHKMRLEGLTFDVGVQGKLKDNLLDVLKHGRTESTTARPWHSPRPCSPGFISSKIPGFVCSIY